MKFRTEYKPTPLHPCELFPRDADKRNKSLVLTPEKPVVMLGSCFSDHIAKKMRECLWHAENPCGTLYNPVSIAKAVNIAVHNDIEKIGDSLFEYDSKWHSWLFDSRCTGTSREEAFEKSMACISGLQGMLDKCQAITVTFGTPWVYILKSGEITVSNCHKVSQNAFSKRRLGIDEITDLWTECIRDLRMRFGTKPVIFTVSPVRYLKESFAGNSALKAVLILAVERLCNNIADCHYFPAYEIMNDDLRDYRFYDRDLVHPSSQGVEYVWEKFCESYIDSEGACTLKEGKALLKQLDHRSICATQSEQKEFREETHRKLCEFKKRHPEMLM